MKPVKIIVEQPMDLDAFFISIFSISSFFPRKQIKDIYFTYSQTKYFAQVFATSFFFLSTPHE